MNSRAAPLQPLSANREPYRVKCSVLRGYVTVLGRSGELAQLRAQVSAATRALLDDPPPTSTWLEPGPIDELADAVVGRGGPAAARKLAREGLSLTVLPLVRPVIESMLRLFGATPATIFRRVGTIGGTTMRGVAFEYQASSEREGQIEADVYDSELCLSRFYRFAGAFELMGELCDKRVRVEEPELLPLQSWGSRARFRVRW